MSVIDVEDLIRVAVDISPLFIIAAGIICFVFAMIRKSWVWLMLSSVFNIAAGISGEIGKHYFDNLPAYGFMAGFTYLGDYLLQFGYEIAGFVLFVVFLVAGSIVLRIHKKREKELLTAIQRDADGKQP